MSESDRARELRRRSLARAVWQALFGNLRARQVCWRVALDLVALNIALAAGTFAWVLVRVSVTPELPAYAVEWLWRYQIVRNAPTYNLAAFLSLLLMRAYSHLPRRTWSRVLLAPMRVTLVGLLLQTTLVYLVHQVGFPMRGAVVGSWALGFFLMASGRAAKQWASRRYHIVRRKGRTGGKVEHVLVIGGAGYIGSVLVGQLLDAGYQVRVLDRLLFGGQSLAYAMGRAGCEVLEGDLRDVAAVVRGVRGTDAVVHLGAIVGDPACALDDEMTTEINYAATQMIREVCRGAGISRFVFASTCSVYGSAERPIHEESPLSPVSLYARSKIASEGALLENRDEDFAPTVLRLATVFGLSPRMRFDLVVNLLAAQAYAEGKIRIFNPDQWRPFISVHDVGKAIVACLGAPLDVVGGRLFNVGDNAMNFTLGEMGETVKRVMPATIVEYVERAEDPRNYRVRFDRVARALGFRCTRTLESGILEIAGALRAGTIPNYRDPIYNNAAFLRDESRTVTFPRHGVLGAWSRELTIGGAVSEGSEDG